MYLSKYITNKNSVHFLIYSWCGWGNFINSENFQYQFTYISCIYHRIINTYSTVLKGYFEKCKYIQICMYSICPKSFVGLDQRIGIRDRIPSIKGMVWKWGNSVCGNSLLIELPADHRTGGGGDLYSSSASVSLLPGGRLHGHITWKLL